MATIRFYDLDATEGLTDSHKIPVETATLSESATLSVLKEFVLEEKKIGDDEAGAIVTVDDTQTVTNKTISASSNTISNLVNANLSASAGIDASKIADGSVSNAEFESLDGVKENIQDQIDGLVSIYDYVGRTVAITFTTGAAENSKEITESDIQAILGWSGLALSIRHEVSVFVKEETTSGGGNTTYEAVFGTIELSSQTDNSVVHLDSITLKSLSSSTTYVVTIGGIRIVDAS